MEYKESLDRRVRVAYRAAYTVLEQVYREGREKLKQEQKNATNRDDFDLIRKAHNDSESGDVGHKGREDSVDILWKFVSGWKTTESDTKRR